MTTQPTNDRVTAAYEKTLPEMRALRPEEVMQVNVQVANAVATVLGAQKEIAPLRDEIAILPGIEVDKIDKLDTYALALLNAHALYVSSAAPPAPLQALYEEAVTQRQILLADITALVARGLINGKRIRDVKGPIGYKNVAVDLTVLVAVLRERWDVVSSKTAVSPAELDRANALADQLMTGVGEREQAPAFTAEAVDLRDRAFTLVARTYEQVRRALLFLRATTEEVDEIAPSLYAARPASRRKPAPETDNATPPTETTAVEVVAPSAEEIAAE